MSDNEIRKILIEQKKKERRYQDIRARAEGVAGFISLILMCLMLTVIRG